MNPSRIFTFVGIVFGAMFVFINAGALPDPWPIILRGIGAVATAVAIGAGLRRDPETGPAPDQQSIRAYRAAVFAEIIAIPIGAFVLNTVVNRSELTVLWVVFVVGAHFLPARAFGISSVTRLGATMIGLALLGAAGTLTLDETLAPATAVLIGFILLVFSATGGFSVSDRSQ